MIKIIIHVYVCAQSYVSGLHNAEDGEQDGRQQRCHCQRQHLSAPVHRHEGYDISTGRLLHAHKTLIVRSITTSRVTVTYSNRDLLELILQLWWRIPVYRHIKERCVEKKYQVLQVKMSVLILSKTLILSVRTGR